MESPVGALSSTPPRDSKKAGYYSRLLFGPPRHTNNSKRPIPNPKAQGSNPLVHHRGELQHMAAELGSYKQAHTSPPAHPGQLQSSGVEGPAPLKELRFQSPSYAWRKRKATKSCLHCLVSYCEEHLQPHYQVTQFKRHKLIEASTKLQENVCTHHGEGRMIFCRTDKHCICYLCSLDEHKGHKTVPAAAEMTKRKKDIGSRRQTIKQIIQDKEKTVVALQQEVEAINHSAEKAVTNSQKFSTDLIHRIQKGSSDLTDKIRSQQQTEVSRAKRIQEKLKQELTVLRRTDAELEKLSQTEDQTQFLHKYISLPPLSKSTALPNMNNCPLRYFEDVTAAVSEVIDTTKKIYDKKWKKIPKTVAAMDVLLPQDPKTRAECSRYAVQRNYLKLDPDTANIMMALSEDNRKATSVKHQQPYSGHSARFTTRSQVLSVKSLTGRCYWEM
ncbi:hypothetical protein L3Q82_001994 [Scortum barcoo]|uniref:Uncharacterized protein n=1 Tax=Scortum barcoo TaxID=214431 RepID=A0ACB8W4B7_9TELE|nr:hypothetical protein L3Q82_001994 [Scortum barcoo]